jgi:hypothetical protein
MGFSIEFSKNFDKNKPSLVFADLVYRVNYKNLFATRFIMNTAKLLAEDFNIFVFTVSNNKKAAKEVMELYPTLSYVFLSDKEIVPVKKKQDPNNHEKNVEMSLAMIKRDLDIIPNVKGVFLRPCVLFKGDMQNELYDCVSDDPAALKIANDEVEKMNGMIKDGGMYCYTMFMTKAIRLIIDAMEYFLKRDNGNVYEFIIDPAHYYKYFVKEYDGKAYYFEDDFRGNRELNEYPMAQLNHLYNADKIEVPDFEDKKNLFMWGGVVLFPKGERMKDWHRLLKDFNMERCALHVAKGSAMKVDKKPRMSRRLTEMDIFEETQKSIENHPLNEGILPNEQFEEKLKDYRYTLILSCLSENDSLNFRVYYSLLYNLIPFVDKEYDTGSLQIPKEFKDKLVVTSSQDLMDKINYYESHLDEAKDLLDKLKDYYLNEKYFKEEYYVDVLKNKYFKELYQ